MIQLVQTITLLTGLILFFLAGYQDYKTHKPTLIMPAMILIGLSQSIIIGMIIFVFAAISLFLLPDWLNKVFGKADVFFLVSMFVLLIMSNLVTLTLTIIASLVTLALIIYYIKTKPNKFIPWVGLYSTGFLIAIITSPITLTLMGL